MSPGIVDSVGFHRPGHGLCGPCGELDIRQKKTCFSTVGSKHPMILGLNNHFYPMILGLMATIQVFFCAGFNTGSSTGDRGDAVTL